MLSSGRLLAFAGTALIVIVIPGPSVLFAVGFGIGALVEQSVTAFTAVKLVGGCYLIYLGFKTFRERRSLAAALASAGKSRSGHASFLQGLTVGATNPKTIVFLAAILPQFASRGAGDVTAQILMLGVIFATIAVVSDTVWVLAAGAFGTWFARSPRRLELVGGVGGLSIAAVGAGFLISGRKN